MKKPILLSLMTAFTIFNGLAQSFVPLPYRIPETGFGLLRKENSLIITQIPSANQTGWEHEQAITWTPSEVPGYNKMNRTSEFQRNNGTWKTSYSVSDSFVLDARQRISVGIEEYRFEIPGFNYMTKTKVEFMYDTNDRPVKYTSSEAIPASSNNYSPSFETYINYDLAGKRIMDSVHYFNENSYMSYYTYSPAGKISGIFTIELSGGDTVSKTFITHTSSGKISTVYEIIYDSTTASWAPRSADTLTYNTADLVTGLTRYGMMSVNGGPLQFLPSAKGSYHYNTSGKIDEIIEMRWGISASDWINSSKYTIFYSGAAAIQGFGYVPLPSGPGWNASPSTRLLFAWPTGLNEHETAIGAAGVYPNPANNKVSITLPLESENAQVTLTDLAGRTTILQTTKEDVTLTADLSAVPDGVYILDIESGNETVRKKLVIAR